MQQTDSNRSGTGAGSGAKRRGGLERWALLALVIGLVASAGVYWFYTRPLLDTHGQLGGELVSQQSATAALQTKLRLNQGKNFTPLADAAKASQTLLPQQVDKVVLATTISTLASSTGVKLTTFNPVDDPKPAQKGSASQSFTVDVTGSLAQVTAFISQLTSPSMSAGASQLPLTTVSKVSLKAAGEQPGQDPANPQAPAATTPGLYDLQFTLQAWLSYDPPLGAPTVPGTGATQAGTAGATQPGAGAPSATQPVSGTSRTPQPVAGTPGATQPGVGTGAAAAPAPAAGALTPAATPSH